METTQLNWMRVVEAMVTRSHKPRYISIGDLPHKCIHCGMPVNGKRAYRVLGELYGNYQSHAYLHADWKDCQKEPAEYVL